MHIKVFSNHDATRKCRTQVFSLQRQHSVHFTQRMTNKSENSCKGNVDFIHIHLQMFSWRSEQMETAIFFWPLLQMKAHLLRVAAPDCYLQEHLTMSACAAKMFK